jgi:hypothetical protein
MNWKTPVDTKTIIEKCKEHKFAATIFMILLTRARNSEGVYYYKGEPYSLSRGQSICSRADLAECCGLKQNEDGRIFRILEYLKRNQLIDKQKGRNCSIITIKDYDELIKFEQTNEQSIYNQQAGNKHTTNTNKNTKSIKSEKIIDCKKLKKPFKDFMIIKCHDGSLALRRFGKWVSKEDANVSIDIDYYPYLKD